MKVVFVANGLPVPDSVVVLKNDWEADPSGVLATLASRFTLPVFVQARDLGSSVGISKAKDPRAARRPRSRRPSSTEDLVEAAVPGGARDRVCRPRNDPPRGVGAGRDPAVARVLRLRSEYLDEGFRADHPGAAPRRAGGRVQRLSIAAFRAVDCAAWARGFLLGPRDGRTRPERDQHDPASPPSACTASSGPRAPRVPALLDRLVRVGARRHGEKQRPAATTMF